MEKSAVEGEGRSETDACFDETLEKMYGIPLYILAKVILDYPNEGLIKINGPLKFSGLNNCLIHCGFLINIVWYMDTQY